MLVPPRLMIVSRSSKRFELDLHVAITLTELLEQHLPQIFRGRSWFATSSHPFDGDANAFIVVQDRALNARQLCVGRDTA